MVKLTRCQFVLGISYFMSQGKNKSYLVNEEIRVIKIVSAKDTSTYEEELRDIAYEYADELFTYRPNEVDTYEYFECEEISRYEARRFWVNKTIRVIYVKYVETNIIDERRFILNACLGRVCLEP